jgi:hypothetical protein
MVRCLPSARRLPASLFINPLSLSSFSWKWLIVVLMCGGCSSVFVLSC